MVLSVLAEPVEAVYPRQENTKKRVCNHVPIMSRDVSATVIVTPDPSGAALAVQWYSSRPSVQR